MAITTTATTLRSIGDLVPDDEARDALGCAVDLRGWNSDHPIFDSLVSDLSPSHIIEVGSWKGRSAAHFASATRDLGARIYCVDTWLGGIDHVFATGDENDLRRDRFGSPGLYRQFLRNFAGKPEAERIFPIQQTSINGARILAHFGLLADLIYIDGSHEYADAYADLVAYAPLLRHEGRMFGDDWGFQGVFAAVVRFAAETGRAIQVIDKNFWVLR